MIVCCGEALIDMLPRETASGDPAFAPYPGGAIFNAAIALGRLGIPVEFLSGLSTDYFGAMLRNALAESNAGTRYVRFSDRPTTLAFVRLNDGHASYTFYDENTAGRMLTEADLSAFDEDVTALLFGAISLIGEPCGSTYEALLQREHERRVIMLDPNIRPDFVPDRERHLARLKRMIAMADIVKLSREDLFWFDETGTMEEIARRWLASGPKLLVITSGAEGACAFTRRHKIAVPAETVSVADTIAAGDTFNAGLLAELYVRNLLSKSEIEELSEEHIHSALALAAKAAAVTVSRPGANPPWAHELD